MSRRSAALVVVIWFCGVGRLFWRVRFFEFARTIRGHLVATTGDKEKKKKFPMSTKHLINNRRYGGDVRSSLFFCEGGGFRGNIGVIFCPSMMEDISMKKGGLSL